MEKYFFETCSNNKPLLFSTAGVTDEVGVNGYTLCHKTIQLSYCIIKTRYYSTYSYSNPEILNLPVSGEEITKCASTWPIKQPRFHWNGRAEECCLDPK